MKIHVQSHHLVLVCYDDVDDLSFLGSRCQAIRSAELYGPSSEQQSNAYYTEYLLIMTGAIHYRYVPLGRHIVSRAEDGLAPGYYRH